MNMRLNFGFSSKFEYFMLLAVVLVVLYVLFFVGFVFINAYPILQTQGISFFTSTHWDTSTDTYGILDFIAGTLWLTVVSMVIACPLSILTAIYLTQYAPRRVMSVSRPLIELLVGVPSVVYGIFGMYTLEIIFRQTINPAISQTLGFIPIFHNNNPSWGYGILLASVVLAVMIMPTIIVMSCDAMSAVPKEFVEASLSIGATRWESIKKIVIPTAISGIVTGIVFGAMRAVGETMAIVMLAGNFAQMPTSILQMCYAMTSLIVNNATEDMADIHSRQALFAVASVLFIMEISLVIIARRLVRKKKWA